MVVVVGGGRLARNRQSEEGSNVDAVEKSMDSIGDRDG